MISKKILLTAIFLFFNFSAFGGNGFAATRTWDGGGATNNWSDAANWSGDVAPTSADDAVFDSTSTKNATVDAAFTVKTISVNSGYAGTITQSAMLTVTSAFTQSAGTFQGTAANATFGTLTLNSPAVFNAPSGKLTFNAGYIVFTFNGGTFNHNNGTIEVADAGGYPYSYFRGQQRNLYNLIVSGWLNDFDNTATRIANNLTVASTGTLGAALHIDGGLTVQTGATTNQAEIIYDDAATRTATLVGSTVDFRLTINNPNITITTGGAAGETISWKQKVVLQAGTLRQSAANYVFSASGGFNNPGFSVAGGTFQGSAASAAFNTTVGISSGNLNVGAGGFDITAASCAGIYFQQSGGAFNGGAGNVKLCDIRTSGGTFTAPSGDLTILSYGDLSAATFNHNNGRLVIGNNVGVVASGKIFNNVALQGANDHDLSGAPIPVVNGTLDLTGGTMNAGGQLAVNGSINYNANFRGGGKQLVFQDTATRTVNLPASIYLLPMLLDNPNITVTTSGASASAIYAGNTEVKRGTFQQGTAELFIGPDNVGGAYDFKVSGGTFVGSTAPFTVRAGGGVVLTGGAFQGGNGLITGNYINTQGGTFSSGGDISIGNYYQSGGTFNAPAGLLTVVADWTHTAGGTFNAGTGSVKFTGYNVYNCANSYTSNVNVTETFYNLEIANSFCNARYIANGDTLIITNNLRLSYAKIGGGRIRPLGTVTIDATNTTDYLGSTIVEFVTPNTNFVINNPSTTVAMLPVEMNAANSTLTSSGAGKISFYGMTLIAGTLNQPNAVWDFSAYPGYTQSGGVFNGSAAQLNISNGATSGNALTGGNFNGGTGLINGGWSQSGGTFSTQGNMNVGQFTLTGGTFNAPAGILDIFNGFTHTAGGTFNSGTGTVQTSALAGVYGIGFDVNATETFNNLKFNGTYNSANHIIASGDTLTVNGTLTFNGRGVNGGSIAANGNVVYSNYGGYQNATSVVKFQDTAARTITFCGDGANCGGVYVQPTLVDNPNITINTGVNNPQLPVYWQSLDLRQGTVNSGNNINNFNGDFAQSGGTFNGNVTSDTFGANFAFSGGTFNAAPNTYFASNFTHTAGGNFNYGTGTVNFFGFGSHYNATIDVNATENFYNVVFNVPNSLYGRTIASGDTIVSNGNLRIDGSGYVNGGTLEAKRNFLIASNGFLGGNSNVLFSGEVNQSFTNNSPNSLSGTWTVNKPNSTSLPENNFAPPSPTNLLVTGTIGSQNGSAYVPLNIVSGNVLETGSYNLVLSSLSISPGAWLVNEYGGSLILSGNVTNDGNIYFDASGSGCQQPDAILIRSSVAGTQRNWSGNGVFRLIDVDVKDQAGTALIVAYSSTDSGNNGTNWMFTNTCAAPTAASVSVSGRVLTANGRGIAKAFVQITDRNGQTRVAVTNPFGYYSFADVQVGETYVLSIVHKTQEFANSTKVLTIVEETDDVNFVAKQ